MSIAANCPQCCQCVQPTVQWDSTFATKARCSYYYEHDGKEWRTETRVKDCAGEYHDPRVPQPGAEYQVDVTRTGSITDIRTVDCAGGEVHTNSGTVTWSDRSEKWNDDDSGHVVLFAGSLVANGDGTCTWTETQTTTYYDPGRVESAGSPVITTTVSAGGCSLGLGAGSFWIGGCTEGAPTYSGELTPASLRAEAIALLSALDGDFSGDAPGSYFYGDTDEADVQQSQYRFTFPVPHAFKQANYRVRWVERFIPESGVGLTSIGVYSPGVYRPAVTIGVSAGGLNAHAIAVMASNGTIASIKILNPGTYDTAPVVTIEAAVNGGTSSTGWTATLDGDGHITAITGGSAGNYLPTLSFAGGGVGGITDAVATCALDADGGIASVTLSSAGSGYTDEPSLFIQAKINSPTDADLLIQLGTETVKCEVWSGTIPGGYDESDDETWPVLTAYAVPVPETPGATLVANVRAVCAPGAC